MGLVARNLTATTGTLARSTGSPEPPDASRAAAVNGPPMNPASPMSQPLAGLLALRPSRRNASPPPATTAPDLRLHAAAANTDLTQIKALLGQGLRPVHLDASRRSPLDVVDTMDGAASMRLELRQALLQSSNASAPTGYAKPEAFHGSPWSLEILVSGELKGGVNDAKGGKQSLEGKVFFSDRTPARDCDIFTRTDLRQQARAYSNGESVRSTAAYSRGRQHRMVQALLDSIARGHPLNTTGTPLHITGTDAMDARKQLQHRLQELLNDGQLRFTRQEFTDLSPKQMTQAVKLPRSLTLEVPGSTREPVTGDALVEMYKAAATTLKASLENGKAPFLALLNKGRVVPVVLGFAKISGLQTHAITDLDGAKNYSYQSESHPLNGSQAGGRLKEIEVTSLQDLATLYLGAMVKGVDIAPDILVRIKPRGKDAGQAIYLAAEQLKEFRAHLFQEAAQFDLAAARGETGSSAASESIEHLQALNVHLRSQPLNAWVQPRI